MTTEQTQVDSDTDSRLNSFFGGAPEAAPEPEAEVESAQADNADEQDETEQAPQTEEASETFEVDGVEYQLPKELKAKVSEWKDGYTRREDYTRKTQEVSELNRQAAAAAERHMREQAFEKSIGTEREELAQLKGQLSQFKNVDWSSLETDQVLRLKLQADALREKATDLEKTIESKRGEFNEWADTKKREVIQSGQKYLQQAIPGWGDKAQKEVIEAARAVGYSEAELSEVLDARQIHIAWKAAQYDKLQAGKATAIATAQKAPPVVKPGGPSNPAAQKDKALRARLKSTGNVKDAYALLAKHL